MNGGRPAGLLTMEEAAARGGIGRLELLEGVRLGELRTVPRAGTAYLDQTQFDRWVRVRYGRDWRAAVACQRREDFRAFKRYAAVTAAKARTDLYASKPAAQASVTRSRDPDTPLPRDLEALRRRTAIDVAKARTKVHGPTRFERRSASPAAPTDATIRRVAAGKAKLERIRRRALGQRADIVGGTWSVVVDGQTFSGRL